MTTIKLSPKQKEAIKLMREGYELGHHHGWGSSVWLQLGGAGKGGKSAKITKITFEALRERGLIETKDTGFTNPRCYHLSETGKTIEL